MNAELEKGAVVHLHGNRAWGGGEYQVLHLVSGLAARHVPAVLYTPPQGALYRRAAERRLPVAPLPRVASLGPLLLNARPLLDDLAAAAPALIHVHDSRAAAVGGPLGRALGIPVVLTRRICSPLRRNWISRAKYSPERLAAIICISEAVRDVVLRSGYPPERTHVVPSGVDVATLEQVERDEALRRRFPRRFLVGGIGKLSRKKNWALLVRTAAALRETDLDIDWLIAGDGPQLADLQSLARRLGVANRVHFLGFRADAQRILKTLDLLFFPSLMEGASVTVREAMALGTPVIAARAPATMESLGGTGWDVDPHDAAGAARTVREALTDPAQRQAKRAGARKRALELFPIEKTVAGTLRVYNALRAVR